MVKGYKSLLQKNPQLALEWHPTKNKPLTPKDVAAGTNNFAWWVCKKGHEWEARINSRNRGTGCPECFGRYKEPLTQTHPKLASEWHPNNNGDLTPDDVTAGSSKKVYWLCSKCNYSWPSTITNRKHGNGCPKCAGKVVTEEKAIATVNPELIEEWHPTRNKQKSPFNVSTGSDEEVVWCCKECGHIWSTAAKSRALRNTGCPKCKVRYNVGFPELTIFFYLKQLFKDAQLNAHVEGIGKFKFVDIYIPSLNLIVEYDGGHTHRNKMKIDRQKSSLIVEKGYKLIRIRDNGLPPLEMEGIEEYLYERTGNKSVGKMIEYLLSMIDQENKEYTEEIERLKNSINIDYDTVKILGQVKPIIAINNALENYPEIEKIWDYKKNAPLKPQHFKYNSNFMVWFMCEKQHSTLAQIGSRVKGHGCKVCAGQVVTKENNLKMNFPEIAKEWNYEQNGSASPEDYLPFSNEVVFWDCPKCESTYDKKINERTGGGENCPYCAGKRVNETNCLNTTHPHLTKEWDYERNGTLSPFNVTKGNHEKVWWICERNHSYPAFVYRRVSGGGCPTCYELYGRFLPKKVKKKIL